MEPTSASSGIVSSIFQPIAYFLFGCILNKIDRMKESKVMAIVIPSGSGKGHFLQNYLNEFNTINSDLYFIDLEECAVKELLSDTDRTKLNELKQKDVLIYQSKLFLICKEYLNKIVQHLKETKIKKKIVILVSSNELKKFLNVKEAFYYAPSKKLYDKIKLANPAIGVYLDYTRKLLEDKGKTFIYTTWEELYNHILKDLKIERTI